MTPDEIMTHVLRAASMAVADGLHPKRVEAFECYLVNTGERIEAAARALTILKSVYFKGDNPKDAERALNEAATETAVSALMTLAHLPALEFAASEDPETLG